MAILQDARKMALEALIKIERGKHRANQVLIEGWGKSRLGVRDRRLVTELVYGVLRHRNRLDWVLGQFCRRPIMRLSPTLRNILRLGAYQLLFLDRIPPRAVVDEAVGLTQRKGAKGLSGFVNAVLRSLDREQAAISYPDRSTDLVRHISICYSHPPWMVSRWLQRYGPERTMVICLANNEVPPVTLRTNTLLTTRERLCAQLRHRGGSIEACKVSPLGLKTRGEAVFQSSPYRKGWIYVQDEAAQLVVLALAPRPGEMILDACAAPGGKTTHIAQGMANQGRIIAMDIDAERLKMVGENCERLGVRIVQCLSGDAREVETLTELQFDRILVDAPCSGLGVLRRNPDGKWHKNEDLIHRYAQLQSEILDAVSPRLRKAGILLYSTCTIEPEENEQVVEGFLKTHPEFDIQDLRGYLPRSASSMITPEGFLFTLFNKESMDGFFAARLIKSK